MLRFVPSSYDTLSLEDLRVAVLNYLIAKQKDEKFIVYLLRDSAKVVELLELFEIKADEVRYKNHNLKFHQQLATKLLMNRSAFNCFCSLRDDEEADYDGTCKELLDSEVIDNEAPFSVRVKRPKKPIRFEDMIDGELEVLPTRINDFMILRVDKYPTDIFAISLDDMLNDISVVIEAGKSVRDRAREIYIRELFGYDKKIEYANLPVMVNDEQMSVNSLLEDGYLPEAILNFLCLTAFETSQEFFTLDDAKELFDISKLSKDVKKFDMALLKKLNKEHLKAMDSVKLATLVGFKSKDIGELAKVFTDTEDTINSIKEKIDKIFSKKECESDSCKKLKAIMMEAPHFEDFEEYKSYLFKKCELKKEEFEKNLRYLLTASNENVELSDIYLRVKNYIKEIVR